MTEGNLGDTERLLRLFTVIGTPAPAPEIIAGTLAALAELLRADLACVAEKNGDRLIVNGAAGLPSNDPAFTEGWPLGPTAREVIAAGSARSRPAIGADRPPALRGCVTCEGVWVPLASG